MSKDPKKAAAFSSYATLGLEFTATLAAFGYLGWWLDQKFSTYPMLMLIIGSMAFIGSMYKMWIIGQRIMDGKETEEDQAQTGKTGQSDQKNNQDR